MGKILSVRQLTEKIEVYKKAEFHVDVDANYINGFDFEEISLDLEFITPDGQKLMHPAFLFKQYFIDSDGRNFVSEDNSTPVWRVRISPTQVGEYSAKIILKEKNIVTDEYNFTFLAIKSDDMRGFIKVEPTRKKAFCFDNGEIFTPIGQNLCWGDRLDENKPSLSMHKNIISKMHKYKANWVRLWLNAKADIGFLKANDRTDNFTNVLDRATRLDSYIELLEQNEMYVCAVFYYHGMFNINGPNTDWKNTAYNKANDYGYIENPKEFFCNSRCIKDAKIYIRYLIARYGFSRNIFCWEFFNEVNFTDGDPDEIIEWHREMCEYVRSIDAHKHMVTTSTANNRCPIIFDPMFDYINMHRYDSPKNIKRIMHEAYLAFYDYDRPIVVEESGENAYGPAADIIMRHQQLWVGIMGNSPATAMEWYWDIWDKLGDEINDPDYAYRDFKPVAEFAARIPRTDPKQRFVSYERIAFNHKQADALGYCGDDYAYIWFYDTNYRTDTHEITVLKDISMDIMIDNGDYLVEWFDTYTGNVFLTQDITVKGRFIQLKTPEWTKDIAMAITKK